MPQRRARGLAGAAVMSRCCSARRPVPRPPGSPATTTGEPSPPPPAQPDLTHVLNLSKLDQAPMIRGPSPPLLALQDGRMPFTPSQRPTREWPLLVLAVAL